MPGFVPLRVLRLDRDYDLCRGFPGDSVVKNLPVMQEPQETWVRSLGREDPGIEPVSPALQADSLPSEPLGKPK